MCMFPGQYVLDGCVVNTHRKRRSRYRCTPLHVETTEIAQRSKRTYIITPNCRARAHARCLDVCSMATCVHAQCGSYVRHRLVTTFRQHDIAGVRRSLYAGRTIHQKCPPLPQQKTQCMSKHTQAARHHQTPADKNRPKEVIVYTFKPN